MKFEQLQLNEPFESIKLNESDPIPSTSIESKSLKSAHDLESGVDQSGSSEPSLAEAKPMERDNICICGCRLHLHQNIDGVQLPITKDHAIEIFNELLSMRDILLSQVSSP